MSGPIRTSWGHGAWAARALKLIREPVLALNDAVSTVWVPQYQPAGVDKGCSASNPAASLVFWALLGPPQSSWPPLGPLTNRIYSRI